MEFSSLLDLIQCLQYGTHIHIGVLFFNNFGNEKCKLPFAHTIHSKPICDEMKSKGKHAFRRCFFCRNMAIKKAMQTEKPFGGLCINGIFEYTHPVLVHGKLACIIFIGNIWDHHDKDQRLHACLADQKSLIDTLEDGFTMSQCAAVGQLIESYIRFLLDKYGYQSKTEKSVIENVKNYLEDNLEYDITIPHITEIFHYNPQYLGRMFKRETGLSIKEYILLHRMERAKKQLEIGENTIMNIATRVGFHNVTYFNRQFKRIFNITPSQYRFDIKQKETSS